MPIRVKSINHTGQVVPNLQEGLRVFKAIFGMEPIKVEEIPGVATLALLPVGDGSTIELIELKEGSEEARRMAASLPAYHFCLDVDDVDAALKTLADEGIELLDKEGRPGVAGPKIGFLAPTATCGLLIELCQRAVPTEEDPHSDRSE